MMFSKETNLKETPIGMIPEDWRCVKIGEVISLEYGKGLPESNRAQGIYPVIGSNGIIGYHSEPLIKGPGIVVGRKGTIGAISWVETDFWPIDTTYYVKTDKGDIFLKWLFYELQQVNLAKLRLSDVVPGLKRDLVYTKRIPLPSLEEQKKIVEVLSCVDLAIQKTDELIAKTERLKEGLMQQLLTRGIGHTEQRSFTELGLEIPKEWSVVSIYDIKANMKGAIVSGPFGSNIGKRFFVKDGVPLIRGNNLTKGEKLFIDNGFVFVTPEKAEQVRTCTALPNDLIFTAAGTLGQVGLIPKNSRYPKYIISNKQLRARIDTDKALPLFLFYWFSSSLIKRLMRNKQTGTSIPVINLGILKSLPIFLPSLPEQQKIAEILSCVDKRLELEKKEKAELEKVKVGLMDLLLAGKIRVGWTD